MFKLVAIEDTIQVPSRLFGHPRLKALEHAINKRYSDKVIPGIGLGIAFWDWIKVGEDSLQTQSGESSTACSFRVVVFAPFDGEVIFGRLSGACQNGLFVELGFFDSIVLPKDELPKPSVFDEKEQVWIWKPKFDGEEQAQSFFMDVSNEYVFRVKETVYDDEAKIPPSERETQARNPMSLVGSLHDEIVNDNQGLGDPLWWYEDAEGGAEEDAGEDFDENDYAAHGEENGGEVDGQQDADGYEDEEMADTWEGDVGQDGGGQDDDGQDDGGQDDGADTVDASKSELRLHDP